MLCVLKKYDAIYVRELELNPFPRWCAKIFNLPYYLEINGLLLLNAKASNKNYNYLRKIERSQKLDYKRAACLIVSSFPRSRWIIENYNLDSDKVFTILNGTDIPKAKKLSRSISLKKLQLPVDGFFLGFLGSVWNSYDLKSIIYAMSLCKTQIPNLYLIIIGGGSEVPYLKEVAKNIGLLSKIVDLGFIQPNDLYKVLGAVDIALMNLTTQGLEDLGPVTTRFATYAAYQIPIIANSLYLENYPNEIAQGLFTVSHENPQALANMILCLYKNPEKRKNNAEVLNKYVLNSLTWKSVTKNILEIMCTKNRSKNNIHMGNQF